MKAQIGDIIRLNESAIAYGIPRDHFEHTHMITEIRHGKYEYKFRGFGESIYDWTLRDIDFELENSSNLFKFC